MILGSHILVWSRLFQFKLAYFQAGLVYSILDSPTWNSLSWKAPCFVDPTPCAIGRGNGMEKKRRMGEQERCPEEKGIGATLGYHSGKHLASNELTNPACSSFSAASNPISSMSSPPACPRPAPSPPNQPRPGWHHHRGNGQAPAMAMYRQSRTLTPFPRPRTQSPQSTPCAPYQASHRRLTRDRHRRRRVNRDEYPKQRGWDS
jgi:hypothetical protein